MLAAAKAEVVRSRQLYRSLLEQMLGMGLQEILQITEPMVILAPDQVPLGPGYAFSG